MGYKSRNADGEAGVRANVRRSWNELMRALNATRKVVWLHYNYVMSAP